MRKPAGQRGATLMELILILAVLGFVIAAAVSFFIFGSRTFTLGSSQAKVQQEARLAATIVSQDLRTAVNIRAYDDDDTWGMDSDDSIVQRVGSEPPYALRYIRQGSSYLETDDIFSDMTFNVSTDSNGNRFIDFVAVGVENGRQYTVNSSMLLENKQLSLVDAIGVTIIIFDL